MKEAVTDMKETVNINQANQAEESQESFLEQSMIFSIVFIVFPFH